MKEMIIDGIKVSSVDTIKIDLGLDNSSNGIYKMTTNKYCYYSEMAKECKIAVRKNDKKKFIKMMRYQIRGVKGKDPKFDPSFLNFENYRRTYLRSLKPFTFKWEESNDGSIKRYMDCWLELIEEQKQIPSYSVSIDPASRTEEGEMIVQVKYMPVTFGDIEHKEEGFTGDVGRKFVLSDGKFVDVINDN